MSIGWNARKRMRRSLAALLILLLPVSMLAQQGSAHMTEYLSHERPLEAGDLNSSTLGPRPFALSHDSYGFHPYWAPDSILKHYRWEALSTLAYFGAEIDPLTGNIAATNKWRTTKMVDSAHAHGVKVHLTAILFSKHDSLFVNTARWTNAISKLLSLARERSAQGLNIDFEAVPSRLRDPLTTFVGALRDSAGGDFEIVIDLPAVDWNKAFDVVALSNDVDRFFLMGYDYHWRTSPTAGAVAPLYGSGLSISRSIKTYIDAGVDRAKLILGLPWYGYDWPSEDVSIGAGTLGAGSSVTSSYAIGQAQIHGERYDPLSVSKYYTYIRNDTVHQVWYDDDSTLSVKYQYAVDEGLAGVGYWATSYAATRAEFWDVIEAVMLGDAEVSIPIHNPYVLYDLWDLYDLSGRILATKVASNLMHKFTGHIIARSIDRRHSIKLFNSP